MSENHNPNGTDEGHTPLVGVSASALKSAFNVCFTMMHHSANAMAGADEGEDGYETDREMYEDAKKYVEWYKSHLR